MNATWSNRPPPHSGRKGSRFPLFWWRPGEGEEGSSTSRSRLFKPEPWHRTVALSSIYSNRSTRSLPISRQERKSRARRRILSAYYTHCTAEKSLLMNNTCFILQDREDGKGDVRQTDLTRATVWSFLLLPMHKEIAYAANAICGHTLCVTKVVLGNPWDVQQVAMVTAVAALQGQNLLIYTVWFVDPDSQLL